MVFFLLSPSMEVEEDWLIGYCVIGYLALMLSLCGWQISLLPRCSWQAILTFHYDYYYVAVVDILFDMGTIY